MPLKIGEEQKERLKGAIAVKGRVTAAQAVAAALIGKAMEGDVKAFTLVYELSEGQMEAASEKEEDFSLNIKVVE